MDKFTETFKLSRLNHGEQLQDLSMYIWNLKKKKASDEPRGRTGIKMQM